MTDKEAEEMIKITKKLEKKEVLEINPSSLSSTH